MIRITMDIDGMMCGMCEAHMNDTVRKSFNVKKVASSHTKGQTVIVTERDIDNEALSLAVSGIGYTLKGVSREPYETRKLFGFWKKKQ